MLIKDFFEVPLYYEYLKYDFEFRDSTLLRPLFQTSDVLEYLRSLYSENAEYFYNTRDELYMRGLSFLPKFQNNLFPSSNFKPRRYLFKREDTLAYKKIDFSLIGLSNFVENFKVESDFFFLYMPLEGIQNLSRFYSMETIIELFTNVGFEIVEINEKLNKQISEESDINEIYAENVYISFVNFCKEKGIKSFSELSVDIFEEFEQKKYIRKAVAIKAKNIFLEKNKKRDKFKEVFNELLDTISDNPLKRTLDYVGGDYLSFLNDFYGDSFNESEYPFYKVKELNNQLLKEVVATNSQRMLKKHNKLIDNYFDHENFKYIANLKLNYLLEILEIQEEYSFDESYTIFDILENVKYMGLLNKIYNKLSHIISPKLRIDNCFNTISERDSLILHERQCGYKLEEIGGKLGVTRERVRQIEKKAMRNLKSKLTNLYLPIFFRYYTEHELVLSLEEFYQRLDITIPQQKSMLKILIEDEAGITFLPEIDLYIATDLYEEFIENIGKIDFSQQIIRDDEIKILTQNLGSKASNKIIDILFREKGYIRGKGIYVKNKVKLLPRINYLFKYIIDKPLEINEQGYEYFTKLMLEYFPFEFNSSKRAITARIADASETILVNSNTYFYHDKDFVDEDFLNKIEDILDRNLGRNSYIDPRIIFEEYKDLMRENLIMSHVHLYSIIQYYLGEKYEHGQGNTLYIYNSDTKIMDAEKILVQYLEINNSEDERINLLSNLKWTPLKLDQLLARVDSVIQIGESKIKLISSYGFLEEELQALRNFIDDQFKDGYAFTMNLLFHMPNQLRKMLKEKDLLDEYSLMAILKWSNPNIRGFSKLLYIKGNSITTLEQVICKEYPIFITRNEIQTFIESYNYSEQTVFKVVRELTEKRMFIQFSAANYINSNQLNFTDEVSLSLKKYLDEAIGNKKYVSVLDMTGFNQKLISLTPHGWTHHLIYEFAEYVGYRKILTTSDYRFNKLVIVKEESNIRTYEDLVYFIVCNEYMGRNHEEDLAKYLESKKLTYNPKRLSNEIYESDYFNFDKFGFYTLKED